MSEKETKKTPEAFFCPCCGVFREHDEKSLEIVSRLARELGPCWNADPRSHGPYLVSQ